MSKIKKMLQSSVEQEYNSRTIFGWFDKALPAIKKPTSTQLKGSCSQKKQGYQIPKTQVQKYQKLQLESNILSIEKGDQAQNLSNFIDRSNFIGVIGKIQKQMMIPSDTVLFQIGYGLELNSLSHIKKGRLDKILAFKWDTLLLKKIVGSSLQITLKIKSTSQFKQLLYYWEMVLLEQIYAKKLTLQKIVEKNKITVYQARQYYWVVINGASMSNLEQIRTAIKSLSGFELQISHFEKREIRKESSDLQSVYFENECQNQKSQQLQQNESNEKDQLELFFEMDRYQGIEEEDERRLSNKSQKKRNEVHIPSNRKRAKSLYHKNEIKSRQRCKDKYDEIYTTDESSVEDFY